jgi:hypothetical protein
MNEIGLPSETQRTEVIVSSVRNMLLIVIVRVLSWNPPVDEQNKTDEKIEQELMTKKHENLMTNARRVR